MAFIAVNELAQALAAAGYLTLAPASFHYLYPVKALSVALLLYLYRRQYAELRLRDLLRGAGTFYVAAAGLLTFLLWIGMDWTFSATGAPQGFDPALLPAGPVRVVLTLFRIAGAVLVVPLMEELFWRSFLLRYLIDQDFQSVAVGRFSWASFLISSLLFGLEHHFIIAGVVAGMIYSVVLYMTRSIAQCVLAHAVTNLALACYILCTGKWYFW